MITVNRNRIRSLFIYLFYEGFYVLTRHPPKITRIFHNLSKP